MLTASFPVLGPILGGMSARPYPADPPSLPVRTRGRRQAADRRRPGRQWRAHVMADRLVRIRSASAMGAAAAAAAVSRRCETPVRRRYHFNTSSGQDRAHRYRAGWNRRDRTSRRPPYLSRPDAMAGAVNLPAWFICILTPDRPADQRICAHAAKRSLMVGVTEGCEVQAGAGEEAAEEAGSVLHPPEPGPGPERSCRRPRRAHSLPHGLDLTHG